MEKRNGIRTERNINGCQQLYEMGNKRKGQLTTDFEWHKHLRKVGKRFFWKGERLAEKKMIEENISEFETQTLSESEMENAEKLYDYLILKLPSSVNIKDLYNLCFSLFSTLDILPDNLRSLKITKDVLALTFMKISIRKSVSEHKNESDWIKLIDNFLKLENNHPNHANARELIGTN